MANRKTVSEKSFKDEPVWYPVPQSATRDKINPEYPFAPGEMDKVMAGDNSLSMLEAQPKIESEQPFQPLPKQGSGNLKGVILGLGLGIIGTVGAMHFLSANPTTETQQTSATPAPAVSEANSAAAQTVTVTPVRLGTVEQTLDTTGTVVAYDLLPVLSQASGLQIQQVLVDEGDLVTQGEVMAVLDDSILRSQILQAQAEVESQRSVVLQREAGLGQTQANLAQAEAGLVEARSTLVQKQARLAEAKANLAQARREVERYEQLTSEGAVSRQELETRITAATTAAEGVRVAEADIRSAEAQIQSAQARIQSVRADVESASANIRSAAAQVRSRQAGVDQLETQLGQTTVRSPATGIIAERSARVGDVTNGSEKLFSIIAENQLELHAKVPETQLPQVKIGAPVTITSDADLSLEIRGTVREIAPLVDPDSRKATVKIDLPPLGSRPNSVLRPGTFLRADITTNSTQGLKIPAKAIVPQANGESIVYRLTGNDTVEATTVEVGELEGSFSGDLSQATVAVKRGLTAGDRVVTSGAAYLKDGDRVNVVRSN
ncbi:MAG: efflux RND transporter periplasmic adaptor subunit [Microcoleaceae cyanobacterium]